MMCATLSLCKFFKELFVSVCFRSCVVLTLAKILLFLLLSKFMNYFFCYLKLFFCFPSRTLFIIVRVLVGFPIFAPLHPLHLCTLCSIFAASPNGGSAGSAAQRGAGSSSGGRANQKKKYSLEIVFFAGFQKKSNQQIIPQGVFADCFYCFKREAENYLSSTTS